MKIGIDIRNVGKKRTGDETVFFHLAKYLPISDLKNEYYYFTDTLDTETMLNIAKKMDVLNHPRVKVIPLPARNKFIWNLWTLPYQLRHSSLDIYLTQYITPWFVPKRIKIITIIHDISFNFFPRLMKLSDWIFLKTLIPISLKRAVKILTVSKFTQKEILDYYKIPAEKVDYFYNAVDLEKYRDFESNELEAIRKKYQLPNDFLMYLGTFQPRKNLPVLIKAFQMVRKKYPTLKLVLVGDPMAHNTDPQIKMWIEKLSLEEAVIFSGFIDEKDKPKFFALAKVFCYPSLYEGFGIPILEALAAKTPVVASDIPPHHEVAEGSVVFFSANDEHQMAEKILEIMEDEKLRNQLREKGIQQVKNFSWLEAAAKVASVFQSLKGLD